VFLAVDRSQASVQWTMGASRRRSRKWQWRFWTVNSDYFDVSRRTALVTGASGGLGEHFAKVLATHGANVVVAARRREKLDSLVKSIADSEGSAVAVNLDVTSEVSVRECFDTAEREFGIVDMNSRCKTGTEYRQKKLGYSY